MRNRIVVLVSTYNGETYLEEQLQTILNQQGVLVDVLVRDDGSKDRTVSILEDYQRKYSNFNFYQGDNLKPALSFLNLLKKAYERDYDYYVLADQDDVWSLDKVYQGIERMKNDNTHYYYSSSTLVNSELENLGINKVYSRFNFEESLLRNNAQGATMILHKEFLSRFINKEVKKIAMHDMYINILANVWNIPTSVDERSEFLLYRQHDNNVLGVNSNPVLKLRDKLLSYKKTSDHKRREMLLTIMDTFKQDIPEDRLAVIQQLVTLERWSSKLAVLKNKNFWHSSMSYNMSFFIDLLMNRY